MGVQFFGQFLIARGEVDAAHIREALELMDGQNVSLGELGKRAGLLDARDVARVHAEQRTRDIAFGDLCVEKGLLAPRQLVELLREQHDQRLQIGDALVRLGHLEPDRLANLLDRYKATQSKYESAKIELPDALANHRAAEPILALFPRFSLRIARMLTKVGSVQAFTAPPGFAEVRVSIPLHGVQGLEVAIVSDMDFARRIAIATAGLSAAEVDPEMVADGVGEFLNVLLGNVLSTLAVGGHPMELGTPDYEAELVGGWIVDLAVDTGRAALVISLF